MSLLYSQTLPLGWEALDFQLKDTEDQLRSLADFADKKGLLIIFTCNHCPYAKASWPILIDLHHQFKNEINFVAINPNDADQYPEDSFTEMKKLVQKLGISFPYLRDQSQKIARAYQAQCTPDLYLFRSDGGQFKLFYHGRINDNWQNPEHVQEKNLKQALKALVNGQNPPDKQPPSMGCSIKWK